MWPIGYFLVLSLFVLTCRRVIGENVTQVVSGITFTSSGEVLTSYMDKDTVERIHYTINCEVLTDSYSFVIFTTSQKVVTVKSVSIVTIHGVSEACNNNNSGVVNGTLNVTLHGKLPGRSQLKIDVSFDTENNVPIMAQFVNSSTNEDHFNPGYNVMSVNSFTTVTPMTRDPGVLRNSSLSVLLQVVCMKEQTSLDTAFRVLMVLFLILLMVAMGSKTDLSVLKTVFKRPIAPLIGLFCQFLIMPLVGFGLTMAFHFPSATMAMGFFACGCAPGGGASNFYAYLLGGDVTLSVAMTTISNIAAIGTFPLWIFTLGRLILTDQSAIKIPYLNIVLFVLLIAVPLSVGIVLKHKRPLLVKTMLRGLMPLVVILLIIVSIFGVYLNSYIFQLITPGLVGAAFLLPNLGFIIGLTMARLLKQNWTFTRTIAIETGVQNIGIALMMVMFSFPPPDNILAGVAPVTSSMMTSIPLLLAAAVYHIYLRCVSKNPKAIPFTLQIDDKSLTDVSSLTDASFEVQYEDGKTL